MLHTHTPTQFSTKQMERAARKCEKEERAQKGKVKKVSGRESRASWTRGREEISISSSIILSWCHLASLYSPTSLLTHALWRLLNRETKREQGSMLRTPFARRMRGWTTWEWLPVWMQCPIESRRPWWPRRYSQPDLNLYFIQIELFHMMSCHHHLQECEGGSSTKFMNIGNCDHMMNSSVRGSSKISWVINTTAAWEWGISSTHTHSSQSRWVELCRGWRKLFSLWTLKRYKLLIPSFGF